MRNRTKIGLVIAAGATLAACGSVSPRYSVEPPLQARSYTNSAGQKVGKPYQIGGVWYVPREQPNYDEVGVASWYGQQFHMKATANGETFDMDAISAAHTTLPLPSMVEVTNLANGRKLIVRVNDRGPFHDNRIIDLSREAARQLGYEREGVTRVRVRYLGPPDLLDRKDGLRYAKNEAKPSFKMKVKPTFQVAPPPVVVPPLTTAVPGAVVATATALPRVVDAITPSFTSPPSAPVVPRSQPITVADLPPPSALPPVVSPPSVSLPLANPPPLAQPGVTVPVSVSQTVSLPPPQVPAPQPAATEVPAPPITPQSPSQDVDPAAPGLRIQAGAFASHANALRAVTQLASAGAATILPMIRADGVTLYRVVLNAPADEAGAYALRDRVEQIGFTDAQVVKHF